MKTVLIWATFAALLAGCSKTPEETRRHLYQKGLKQIESYEFADADSTFQTLKRDFPSSLEGRFGSGLVLESQLLHYDAMQVYMAAIEADSAYVPARVAAARIYSYLDKWEDAAREYSRAVALPGSDVSIRGRLVTSLTKMRDFEIAQRVLDEAAKAGLEESLATVLKAQLQFHRQQLDSASETVQAVLSNGAASAELYAHLADFYESRCLVDSAVMFSGRSLTADNATFVHRYEHLERCLRHGYMHEAHRLLDDVGTKDETRSVLSGMELLYNLSASESRDAKESALEYWQLHPRAISPIMYDIPVQWMTSGLNDCLGNLEMARKAAASLEFVPSFKDFMYSEIELASMSVTYLPDSQERIRNTRGYKNGEREFLIWDAYTMRRRKVAGQFDSTMEAFFTKHGDDPIWQTSAGDLCARRDVNAVEEAERFYRQALNTDPYYRPALENWVDMYVKRQRYDDAGKLMREHAPLVHACPVLLLKLAELTAREGDTDSALSIFEKNIVHITADMHLYEDFARVLARQGGMSQAKDVISSAVMLCPDNVDAYHLAAELFADFDDPDSALVYADRGLEINPRHLALAVQKARCLTELGHLEDAVELFEELRGRARSNVDVNMYFARCLAAGGENSHSAENMARAAIFQSGSSYRSLLNACVVFSMTGKFKDVKVNARKARVSQPDSPEAYYYLGYALHKISEDGVKENLEKAIELGLWGEKLTSAQEILAELRG